MGLSWNQDVETLTFDELLAMARQVVDASGIELLYGASLVGFNIRTGSEWWVIVHADGPGRLRSVSLPVDRGLARAAESLESSIRYLVELPVPEKEKPAG